MDVGELHDTNRIVTSKRIPVVLSQNKVANVLSHMSGTHWIMAMLLYGGGLRRDECIKLRVRDVDFDYRCITIICAKGAIANTVMHNVSLVGNIYSCRHHNALIPFIKSHDDGIVLDQRFERRFVVPVLIQAF